ncbi:FxsC protein [Micromonospora echinaurantiaca]|uniref:FxsC protein n=1 Tax=Micromonospora echinaurantiaca TaxID=47857 RepID=UPI00371889DF
MASIFLSYRPDDDGAYAEAFLGELCDAVRLLSGGDTSLTVFTFGDDAVVDGEWTRPAAQALAECTVFLAICSQRYFLTERCGREWSAFQDRLHHHETITGRRPKAVVPVAWGDNGLYGDLPAGEFTTDVARRADVRALVRLTSNRSRYRDLLGRLARHIVEVSRTDPVRPAVTLLPYAVTPNAFRTVGDHAARPAGARAGFPSQSVRFVVAAGRRDEMAPVREDLDFYGPQRADWRPYRPLRPQALATQAQAVAADHLFDSDVVDDIEDIVGVLERADADDELLVMLIDAWVVRIAAHREALAEVDRRADPATGFVVPISATDPETSQAREQLTEALSRLLALRSARCNPMLRIGPDSAEEFEQELGGILEASRNLTFRSADVRRVAPGAPAGSRPLLDAP